MSEEKEKRAMKLKRKVKTRLVWQMNPVERIHGKPKGYKRVKKDWRNETA